MSESVWCDGSDPSGATGAPTTPLIVAVTGGIGAGKSTVSAGLAARGGVMIDADRLAREVVAPGTPGLAAVAEVFGPTVLTADGALDRAALGRRVFADRAALERLESITHPLVRALSAERLAAVPADGVAINDIPLIRSMSEAARYHLVVGVGIADEQVRIRRLISRGHTELDARSRIAAQISDDERRGLADVWIDNAGSIEHLEPAIDALWARLLTFAAHRRAGTQGSSPAGAVVGGLTELDMTALTCARVAAACGGRTPEVSTSMAGDDLTITVLLDDRTELARFRPALADAGFPSSGPDTAAGSAAAGAGSTSCGRFSSADPGLSLNLYLTVKG